MNSRERFIATLEFQPVDHVPLWEFGYWPETIRRWYKEGLTKRAGFPDRPDLESLYGEALMWDASFPPREKDVHLALGFDEGIQRVPLNSFMYPAFERQILEEEEDSVVLRDERGNIRREKKDRSSAPQIIKTAVESREEWETLREERFQPILEGRLPEDWSQQRRKLETREFPLAIGGTGGQCGFFHATRYLMGPVRLFNLLTEQPDLIKDIMNSLADFWVSLFDQILSRIDVDLAFWTEDIAYKTAPFISPDMFSEFMLPCYKKLIGMLRDHGVKIILIDSDGNNWLLIPLFIEAGVTGMVPMEVAAGMDVLELRKAFPKFQILGGIDKRAVAKGREAIDEELNAKVPQTLKSGGYIPYIDHLIPPDISWEDFKYYRMRLAEMIGSS